MVRYRFAPFLFHTAATCASTIHKVTKCTFGQAAICEPKSCPNAFRACALWAGFSVIHMDLLLGGHRPSGPRATGVVTPTSDAISVGANGVLARRPAVRTASRLRRTWGFERSRSRNLCSYLGFAVWLYSRPKYEYTAPRKA